MEIGEYIRTKGGVIDKIDSFEKDLRNDDVCCFYSGKICTVKLCNDIVTKHSFNIIDLIEENDIVRYKVNSLSEEKVGRVRKYTDARGNKEYLGTKEIVKINYEYGLNSFKTHEAIKKLRRKSKNG